MSGCLETVNVPYYATLFLVFFFNQIVWWNDILALACLMQTMRAGQIIHPIRTSIALYICID